MTHDVSDRERRRRKGKSSLSKEVRGASRGAYRTAQSMQAQNLNQNTERKPESRTCAGRRTALVIQKANVNSMKTDNEAAS